MSDELIEHAVMQNWRVLAYGVSAFFIILAGCLLALAVGPSAQEKCAASCGKGQFKSWTAHLEAAGFSGADSYRPAVPEKCECKP